MTTSWELTPEERRWLTSHLQGTDRVGRGVATPLGITARWQREVEKKVIQPYEEELVAKISESKSWDDAIDAAVFIGVSAALMQVIQQVSRAALARAERYHASKFVLRTRRMMGPAVRPQRGKVHQWLRRQAYQRSVTLILRMLGRYSARVGVLLVRVKNRAVVYTGSQVVSVIRGARKGLLNNGRVITRDQIVKFISTLTEAAHKAAGITDYIWWTMLDERVRPSHQANHGKRFRWDKPPPVTRHPGYDINCRCIPIPVLEEKNDPTTL